LVVDLQWPRPPAVAEGTAIALIMATAGPLHAGAAAAGDCAWALHWRDREHAPRVLAAPPDAALPPEARPDCSASPLSVARDAAPPPAWRLRLDLPASACGEWRPQVGDEAGLNAILLAEESAGQWSFSADASTWCWITPDLWGRLLLVDGGVEQEANASLEER
jgi:hypothetical protein